ncbi:DUF305 domain-containing protein [Egbenema bharatensis]|uniref:DUF305 domain-containing protein n=1 Tax=Egbenema bharatensis TaxID=3463334 RepID=UPI003A8A96FF
MQISKIALIALASLGLVASGAIARQYRHYPMDHMPMSGDSVHHGRMHHGRMHHGGMMHDMHVESEFEYLSHMIPHHQEAIDTAQIILERSDRPAMQAFAQEIIAVQTAEIERMETWLSQWYPSQTADYSYTPMMRDLSNLQGDELDRVFLEDMIMHHMGAVMMSQMLLNRNLIEHEPVRPFAQTIASTQRQEIHQMRAWLQDWFGASTIPNG